MAATRIGTTSFTLGTELRRLGEAQPLVVGETVYVLVGERSQQKMAIPAENRRLLEEGAAGVVVDHAGALKKA